MENVKIFVVEDDQWYTKLLEKHLRHIQNLPIMHGKKLHVITYTTAESCYDDMHRSPSFIILDHWLDDNGMNGLELVKLLRAENYSTPIFILSGQSEEIKSAEMIKAGASEYLSKNKGGIQRLTSLIQVYLIQQEKVESLKAKKRTILSVSTLILFIVLYVLS